MTTLDIINATRYIAAKMTPAEVDAMRYGVAAAMVIEFAADDTKHTVDYYLGCVDGAIERPLPDRFMPEYLDGYHKYNSPAMRTQRDRMWWIVSRCIRWKQRNGAWSNERRGMIYAG